MKRHHCTCEYAIFPFGKGAPVCLRKMEQTGKRSDLVQCNEKGCEFYKSREEQKNDRQTD